MNAKGCLYCILSKALYGCVQASRLWLNKLIKFLKKQGYKQSLTDPWVMCKVDGDKISLLLIFVNDIMVIADCTEFDRLKEFIRE